MDSIKKELSIGTIITDGQYILGCLPSGRTAGKHSYDLPKGHWEEGETYIETAVRECKEETDFELWPDHLVDLGKYEYIPTKDIYLFLVALDFMPDLSKLKCTTDFKLHGKKVPEVASYKLIPVTELDWFFQSLEPVVAAALENFDKRIEEDEKATVALPKAIETIQETNFAIHSTSSPRKIDLEVGEIYTSKYFKTPCSSSELVLALVGGADGLERHLANYKRIGADPEQVFFVDWDAKGELIPELIEEARKLGVFRFPEEHFYRDDIRRLAPKVNTSNRFRNGVTGKVLKRIYLLDYDGTIPILTPPDERKNGINNQQFWEDYVDNPLSKYMILVGAQRAPYTQYFLNLTDELNLPRLSVADYDRLRVNASRARRAAKQVAEARGRPRTRFEGPPEHAQRQEILLQAIMREYHPDVTYAVTPYRGTSPMILVFFDFTSSFARKP